MSRYFFDFHDGVTLIDEVGIDLDDLEAARAEAIRSLGAIASDFASSQKAEEFVMVVRDDANATVLTVRLTLKVSGPGL